MDLIHLPRTGWLTRPWKNGLGETDEIHTEPAAEDTGGAGFGFRLSSAPILSDGAFSAFPGIDRVLTVIEGAGLGLDFGGRGEHIAPLMPFRFDGGLAPVARLPGGPVRVLNLMAARAHWRIGAARVLDSAGEADPGPGGRAILFVAAGGWRVETAGQGLDLGPCDTALVAGGAARPAPRAPAARAILLVLAPVESAHTIY